MSVAEGMPFEQIEPVPDFPRDHLGEIINDQSTGDIDDFEFRPGLTIGELAREVVDNARNAQEEVVELLTDRDVYISAQSIQIKGASAEILDPKIRERAEEVIHSIRGPLRKTDTTDEYILEKIEEKLAEVNSSITKVFKKADEVAGLFAEIFIEEIWQSALELGFETDIESPLSWSQETWQAIGSMTEEEQKFFSGKKKQSNDAKRVWARRANAMLDDEMPDYNYQEWKAMEVLAAEAELANAMLRQQLEEYVAAQLESAQTVKPAE